MAHNIVWNGFKQMEWDGSNRRPSSGLQQQPGMDQLPGGGTILQQQQQQQQRLENERELQRNIHDAHAVARPVESENIGAVHGRRLSSSEMMRLSSSTGARSSEELGNMVSGSNPVNQLDQYYQSPSQLQQGSAVGPTGPSHYSPDPNSYESHTTHLPASAGSSSTKPPSSSSSFAKLHSSSISVDASDMGHSMGQVQKPGFATSASHDMVTQSSTTNTYDMPTITSSGHHNISTASTAAVPTSSSLFQSSSFPYGVQNYEQTSVASNKSMTHQVMQESTYQQQPPVPSTSMPTSSLPPVSDPSTSAASLKMLQLQQQQQQLLEQQQQQEEQKKQIQEQQRLLEEQKKMLEQQKLQQQQDELAQREIQRKKQETAAAAAAAVAAAAVDDKANALMEELSKLQSAVDSTLKKRTKVVEKKEKFIVSPPSPSPSPSPPPFMGGGKKGKTFRFVESSPSPEQDYSPDSPETAGPRKAIVLRDYDLDDYKSSSEEESESESDKEQVYYDHNPGEVYTIPEEEDEGGSPTGGDLVTSLKKKTGKSRIGFHGLHV